MNKKLIVVALLVLSVLVIGCMRSSETLCDYDGICEEWETDDCPDCADVLGRGIPLPPMIDEDVDEDIVVS